MLKISKQYLDLHQSYDQLTENSEKQMAYLQQDIVNFDEGRPFVSLKFQLFGHNIYVNQDSALKFSVFAKMTKENWTLFNQCVSGPPKCIKTSNASRDHICWDIFSKKILVRFWTHISYPMEGI